MNDLLNKKCKPCEGGVLPFDINEIHKYQKKVDGLFGWGYSKISITTHAIEGLSENDFILAAKIDQIFNV
jgi:4a-hydroxytetrahydrobiopterin dehydratase